MGNVATRWILVVPAALFGAALAGTAFLASRALGERDAAVREGILVRAGHALEARLRETPPAEARALLEGFLERNAAVLAGIEVLGPAGVMARAGETGETGIEIPAALGRAWRGPASPDSAAGPPAGRADAESLGAHPFGRGPGRGAGRGDGGRGGPPFRIRLVPAAALGKERLLASALVAGGAAAAVALVALAAFAARGIAERQRREAAEAEGERLRTVAKAGAGLAHQLRNPLAVVKGTAQHLAGRLSDPERGRVERIVASSERMETILSRLLDFASPAAPQATPFDLSELARGVVARTGENAEVDAPAPVPVRADREHAEGILEELLANARAFDPAGRLDVVVRRAGSQGIVQVADRGPGPQVDAAAAFEPYVTSRPEGTGLGLAIVRSLASANGGSASLAPRPGGGCVASLALPGEA